MGLKSFIDRAFNPEKWLRLGLIWGLSTVALIELIERVRGEPFELGGLGIRLVIFVMIGAPIFGLSIRWATRRKASYAR